MFDQPTVSSHKVNLTFRQLAQGSSQKGAPVGAKESKDGKIVDF